MAAASASSAGSHHLRQLQNATGNKIYNEAKSKKLYIKTLYRRKRGLPIWRPNGFRKPFEIGDLGYFDPGDHCFTQLFNVTVDADKQPGFTLPSFFQPLKLAPNHVSDRTADRNELYYKSIGVLCESSGLNFGEAGHVTSSESYLDFIVPSRPTGVGVALITGDPIYAQRISARYGHFVRLIRNNARKWFAFNDGDSGLAANLSGGLYLVTGVHLQESWAIGYFGRPTQSLEAVYKGKILYLAPHLARFRGHWPAVPKAGLDLREGRHTEPDMDNLDPYAERVRGDLPSAKSTYSQCVFMEGFKVRKRWYHPEKPLEGKSETIMDHLKSIVIGPKKKKIAPDEIYGAANPQDLPPPPPPGCAPAVSADEFSSPCRKKNFLDSQGTEFTDHDQTLDDDPEALDDEPAHPVDAIIDYIFKTHPSAEFAFAHDHDIPTEYWDSPHSLFTYADLMEFLEKKQPPVDITSDGVGSLLFKETLEVYASPSPLRSESPNGSKPVISRARSPIMTLGDLAKLSPPANTDLQYCYSPAH
ncbi:hypothetical protein DL96DRAFT_837224 [Flagelloscypha sp. PMI_526]|nr:hypothetical protein DL96DRAFT_837224 [Flagelloscypha sp. PMI_526]